MEQLEESKHKIEGLLGWISNIGNEKVADVESPGHISRENGNLPEETSAAGVMVEETDEDDANGNGPHTTEDDSVRKTNEKNSSSPDIDKQYDRVKVYCERCSHTRLRRLLC